MMPAPAAWRCTRRILPGAGMGIGLVALLLPLVPLLVWALARNWTYPSLLPKHGSLRGVRLLTEPGTQIPHGLLLSTTIGVTVAVVSCAIGLPAGRALGLYRFRGERVVRFLLLAPVLVPGIAVVMGLQVFFLRAGLAGTPTGVVLVQLVPTVPYTATVLGAAYANYDLDYERQARVSGAGPVQVGLHVTLPLLRPALVTAGLFAFLISWSDYLLTLLIGGGAVQTLPVLLFAAIGSSDTTAAAALGVLVVLPPLLLVSLAMQALSGSNGSVIGFARP